MLLAAADHDADLFTSLLAQARADLTDGVREIKQALRSEDLRTVARHAHSVKSVAGLLDDDGLHERAAVTQDAADAGDLVGAVQAFLPLHAAIHDLAAVLAEELAPAAPAAAAPAPASPWSTPPRAV